MRAAARGKTVERERLNTYGRTERKRTWATYKTFSLSNQRNYIRMDNRSKTETTRTKRLKQAIEMAGRP